MNHNRRTRIKKRGRFGRGHSLRVGPNPPPPSLSLALDPLALFCPPGFGSVRVERRSDETTPFLAKSTRTGVKDYGGRAKPIDLDDGWRIVEERSSSGHWASKKECFCPPPISDCTLRFSPREERRSSTSGQGSLHFPPTSFLTRKNEFLGLRRNSRWHHRRPAGWFATGVGKEGIGCPCAR